MRKQIPFCCDTTRSLYEEYYVSQGGNGMNVFQGARVQRGHGFGSFLSGLFRSALPILKSGAKVLGKQVLRTGLQIANDVVEGQSFCDSSRRRIPEGIKSFVSSAGLIPQSGSGRNRRLKRKSIPGNKKRRVDIFDEE